MRQTTHSTLQFLAILLLVASCVTTAPAVGRRPQSEDIRYLTYHKAEQLFYDHKYDEAVSLLEGLTAEKPDDADVLELLARTLVQRSWASESADQRRKDRLRARALAQKARSLGKDSAMIDVILTQVPEDGSEVVFSTNDRVDALMQRGERAFSSGLYDQAIGFYSEALSLDPKLYEAVLFIGDCHFVKKDNATAVVWFERASRLQPDTETAFRYWGDALLAEGRTEEAKERFLDAIVADPFTRTSWVGLIRWAQTTGAHLSHPPIQPPASVVHTDEKNTNITLDPAMLKSEGGIYWVTYSLVRASWTSEKFKKTFPNEKTYRHSLAEESDALAAVAAAVEQDITAKKVSEKLLPEDLAALVTLHRRKLIEPFVLFALVDEGIAVDYAEFRKAHRDQLRKYLGEVVVSKAP